MEVRLGGKKTDVGVVPEDWEIGRVSDLIRKMTSGLSRRLQVQDIGIPVLISGNIQSNRLATEELKYWYEKDPKGANINDYILDDGDILVCFINSISQIGKTCIFRDIGRRSIYTTNLFRIVTSNRCVIEFAYFLFISAAFQEALQLVVKPAVNQASFTKPDFLRICIGIPPVAEQEAIAEALSDADALSESLEQLLAKKRQVKQGAMQELLTGKKRLPGFSGEWEVNALGEIATAIKGSQLSSTLMTGHGSFPHLNGGTSPSGYTDVSNAPGETIAISEGGNSCGYVQFMSEPYWCGGHCYSVIPNRIDNRFLYHALKGEEPSIMGLRVGSGLPNVQKKALLAFTLRCPEDTEEQTAIAAILSDMVAEIAALEAKLTKARQLKQGMMQELLTGRIRLT